MNLYLISQDAVGGYDTYDSAVVAAESADDARRIHPCEFVTHESNGRWMGTYSGGESKGSEYENESSCWVMFSGINLVKAEFIGETIKQRGVICASYNAG